MSDARGGWLAKKGTALLFALSSYCCSVFCRSFSELYQKAIKDAECQPGEDQSGEAWVLDEREKDEEEDKLKAGGVGQADIMEVQVEAEESEGQSCDGGQSERSHGPLLSPPSLPLLRATSLQDQPANQSQEGSASQLTRSCSLERRLSFRDTFEGWVHWNIVNK